MNAQTEIASPLALLREPFPAHQVSKLPKETKKQADDRKAAMANGQWPAKCPVCEGHHHAKAVHLDYVGHAALTDRLLDVDPEWSWEPLATDDHGLPAYDGNRGLWIKLTVAGVTRLGYGSADGKSGGDAVKEMIGDALRNAAMRFGAALDLWHKGDLHLEPDEAAGGQSEEGAQSASGSNLPSTGEQAPVKGVNWGGRYPTKMALKKAMHTHHAELERLAIEGSQDDLDEYLTSPEYVDYIKIAGEHAPYYLEGERHKDAPPEFVQTFTLESIARDRIGLRGGMAGGLPEYIERGAAILQAG